MAEKIEQTSDTSTAPVTDGAKSSRDSKTPPTGNKKARDGSHGLKFETKLLTLFCVRGLSAGYNFELGKENEDLGGKFDDVIFRYEVPDETPVGKHWRYHYLQAKHKENENGRKITVHDLLQSQDKAPFGLRKYFLSYCKMRERGDDVRDCIVCTNADVDKKQFKKIQLEEVKEQHDILKFAPGEKTVGIYKLKIYDKLRSETIKLLGVSDIVAMGMTVASLPDTSEVQFRDKETTNSNEDEMLSLNLVTEKVVDLKTKKFRPDFINGENLSVVTNKFRQKIVEVIDDFYNKLVFVVNMPNETQFKKIIQTEDASKYYPSDNRKIQTTRIFDEISDAFENKPANFWLTSEEAKKILLAGVTDVSSKYQKQLEEEVEFNEDAIKVMGRKLRHLIDSSGREKVERIATPSPRHTAVKVISAVQILMREFKQEGNYMITPSSRLKEAEENRHEAAIKDEIHFTDLSDNFQEIILSKPISFQGENVTVGDLVGDQPEEVMDFNSMKELLLAENEIQIPSFNTSTFEQSLYVKRRLKFPFENQFELGGECRINSVGHIEWLVGKEKQKEVWEKIMNGLSNQASSTGKTINDIHLTNFEKKENEKSIVIIFGVAGTGKSTLLSYYYKQIKTAHPDHWVIRINLVDYEAVLKLDQITDLDVVDLFINRLHVVDSKSQFFRSLLRKRLETGDRIVVMFDGFDEINELCQKGAIEWMKAISKNKSIRLYVTTRTHMSGDLQFQLSQLAYSLENFTEKDQIDYLTSYWIKELNLSGDNDESLQHFAKSLVERVSETLKDEEKSFIGIPLQCRILAECFQSNVKELITLNNEADGEESRQSVSDKISNLLGGEKFDLVKLYNLLMETKRQVFREEKAKAPSSIENKIVTDAINLLIKNVESHLTKLAIETIVEDERIVDVLWPPPLIHQSNKGVVAEEKMIAMNSLSFGLTIESGENKTNATQFLHRTYAEFLFARYLYEGFLVDDERHNKLLENESIQKLILNKILSIEQYDGVQVFFNCMLKELVDDDQEWRNRIIKRNLPERFTKFANNLFTQFLRKYPSSLFPFKKVTRMILQQSKKHFVRGRIGKMLIILNELKRHNLLTRLYGTILVTEPEAFHSIYKPIEEEGLKPADLHFLFERDSYRLTRLHRVAFHGNTEAVEEMLERIRQNLTDPEQKEVADKIITEVLARDEYGFTPLYVAAACGHEEIYHKMLAFLKQVLPGNTLEEHLIDEGGFVHRALSDAIQSENIQICKTEELFSAMVKIVVTRDDNVANYTDLYDLLSQRYWAGKQHTLKFIDAESLQGLLLLKGVEDFTKCILDSEDLVFEDLGNGTTAIYAHRLVLGQSYWRDYIKEFVHQFFDYPDSNFIKFKITDDGFLFRGYVDRICECFKYVGDNSAKELLLHEDAQGYITSIPQHVLKLMLNCLTQESQQEVKQKWKNNAPLSSKGLPLTTQILSNDETCPPRYCRSILHFYLEYGSEDHLKEFAKVVTVLHNISRVQHSLWSYAIFENYHFKETHEILELVSEKTEFIGRDDVKQLMLHEIDNVPFIIKAVSWGEDIDLWLEMLPNEIREEIQQFIHRKAPDFIEKAFHNPTANEHQLQSFVQNITSKRVGSQQEGHERSMWAELFTHDWESDDDYGKIKMEDFAKMNKFMKMVSEKLGPNAVKELVLHQDGELLVVFYLALRGEEKMLETLLNYLPAKDRKEVQSKVDKFLDETYKIPQDDDWSKFLNDIF
ncbi:hypothetical protein DAPPUDRAFT_246627 [Daphnia pulex]|uniref:NACHT domain-containing protein n=1 Tax=Daphnia pulex TaxID=6669 RepID=E9GQ43_DAPPU|nr:hypothetical protein DAPPUDRAFT_246627 [Daphnia pulex]|eukprot:EFX78234.1 hypothetical protein DAPPUDRAFT_246627 [Daphnia pulex]